MNPQTAVPVPVPVLYLPEVRRLRGLLAEAQVSTSAYARACSLSRVYVGRILSGNVRPGELATIKLARGLVVLGLSAAESEVRRVS